MNAVSKELALLARKPIDDDISIILNFENMADIQADIKGPIGTPFEHGVFRIRLVLSPDFPASPPKGYFVTKVFHPNVHKSTGEICVSTLKKDWTSTTRMIDLLTVIKCLLIAPNPESALNEEAGKLLLEDYAAFEKHAAMMTKIHAIKTSFSQTIPSSTAFVENKVLLATNASNNTKNSLASAEKKPIKKRGIKRL